MRKTARQRTGLKPWVIVMVAFLDDIFVIGLVFIALRIFNVKLSVLGVIVIGLVLGTFAFIVHRAVVPSLRLRRVTGAEGMVGQLAVVTECLCPNGTVQVYGEYWKADCGDDEIEEGAEVEIIDVAGLKLEVRRKP